MGDDCQKLLEVVRFLETMLPGFNHNIRHNDILFHVQTEDCGTVNPSVVTHLFMGGNVVASRRLSYAKFVSKIGLRDIVLAMMQEQHKEMMKDLVHGRIQAVQDMLGLQRTISKEEIHVPRVRPTPPSPPLPTLDTSHVAEKTLDELIMEFLAQEEQKKK